MTEPKKYWITDGQGNYAQVSGATERDNWSLLGWAETDEPTEGFVHVWHEGIDKPGVAPIALYHLNLEANGWVVGPPEGADHPLAAAAELPEEPPAKTVTKKTAAGGNQEG